MASPSIIDSLTTPRSVSEETLLSITEISVSDTDASDIQTITLTVTQGTLTLASTDGLTGVTGNGTSTISFSGSLADVNAALNGMGYLPNSNYSGNETLAMSVNDGSQTVNKNILIAVTPVNDAPTIAPSVLTVAEGSSLSFAASNFGIADVDNQNVQIIVKLDQLPSKGYLTLGGSRLVAGSTFSYDQVTQLEYHHDGGQTTAAGGTSDSFKVTVDDGAGGTIASTVIPIAIAPVNQLPSVSGTTSVFEGEVDHAVTITLTDPDQTGVYSIEILSLPVDGVLKFNGMPVTVGQKLSSADLIQLTYSHDGNDDNNGFPPPDSFQIKVLDDGGGTGTPGSTTATINLDIKPNNDDPLLAHNTGMSLNVQSDSLSKVITASELQVTDVDSPTAQLTYTLTAIPDATIGTLQRFDGTDWKKLATGSTFTQADIDGGRLRYVFHKASSGGATFADSFKFQVRDSEIREYPTSREGGIWKPDGSGLETFTFNIGINLAIGQTGGTGGTENPDVPSNNPPTIELNTGIANLNEGSSTTITNALLKATDTDNTASELVYRIVQLPTSGSIKLGGVSLGLYGSFTQADIDQNRVTFEHAGGEDFLDQFKFTLSDGKNVTFEQSFSIDITPQNDAPVVTVHGMPSLAEAGTVTIDETYLTLSDVDGTGEKSGIGYATINSLTFRVTVLPVYGKLQVDQGSGFVDVTATTVITKAQLDGGKLRYVHDGTENFSDSFSVQANDNTTGTANSLSAIKTVDISIAKLNDSPSSLSSKQLTVAEAGSGTIQGSNGVAAGDPHLVFSDPDNTTIQRQYRITDATDNGQLFRNGQALAVGSVFTQDDLDNNRITYTHNGTEKYSDSFSFTVSDGGGTAVPGTYSISITPANDPPTLTVPGTQNFGTATPLVFSSTNGNRIVVDDVDLKVIELGETDILQVTLDLQAGGSTYSASTLTLGSAANLTVLGGTSGTAGGKITFQGTKAAVQAALDGLQLQVPNDEDKTLSLVITVDDLLNGSPGSPAATGAKVTNKIDINTSNVNDPATITKPAILTVNEDTAIGLTGANAITIADVDAFGSTNNTVTVTVNSGKLSVSNSSLITAGANNSSTITLTGSLAAINAALTGLSYQGNSNFNGSDELTITFNDQGNLGTGGAQTVVQKVPITVTPVNDSPTLTAPSTPQTIASTSPLEFSSAQGNAISIDDIADLSNNGADTFTVTLSATSSGNPYGILTVASGSGATVSGSGASITLSGTKAQINAALNGLSYAPEDYNSEATVNLGVVVSDNANGGAGALTASKNITINTSDINNAPVLTYPTSIVASEDTLFTFSGASALVIADPDDFGSNLQVSLSVGRGILSLGSTAGLTFISGANSSAAMTIEGTEAALNAAIAGLKYQGNTNFNGPDALTIKVDDLGNTGTGGAQIVTRTTNITVAPVNDAPTRSGAASTVLISISEDASNPAGTTISSLLTSKFSDAKDNQTAVGGSSANSLAGIAITSNGATASTQGRWQWFDGTTWQNISTSVSTASALVLSASTLVRFLPLANFNGTPGNLTARLIDTSAGAVASGSTVNVSSSGGTTRYSDSSNSISLTTTVIAVNDAPIASGTATLTSSSEDTLTPSEATITSLFSGNFSDTADQVTNGSTANTLAGIAIVANAVTTQGTWEYFNGSSWQTVGNCSSSNALLVKATDKLRFVPAQHYNGTVPALGVHLVDSSAGSITTGTTVDLSVGAVGGITAYSNSVIPLITTIDPVNDAPTFSQLNDAPVFAENGSAVLLDADATVNDVDLAAINNWNGAKLTLQRQGGASSQDSFENGGTLAALTQGGDLTVAGNTIGTVTTNSAGKLELTFNSSATTALVNSVLQQITYRNTSEKPPSSVTISYTINDGNTGLQGSGGALSANGAVAVSIAPVNDAPLLTAGATVPYTENQPAKVVDGTITLNDADDTQIAGATVSISGGFTNGDVLAAVTAGTNIIAAYSDGTLTLSGLDTLAHYQQVLRSVSYSSTSEEPTQISATRTITWQVTDANSDGVGAKNSAAVTSTITVNALPDPVNDNFTINEDTVLTDGVADADSGDKTASYSVSTPPTQGTLKLNSDGTFTYTPSQNFNGTDSFVYTVTDGNGDTKTATATITVGLVKDAVNDTIKTDQDQPVNIDVLANDTFGGGATVQAVTQGSNGTVEINQNGTVKYTPKAGFKGADSFTYTVTANGITESATVDVTVNAIPDAVDDAFVTNEDAVFSGSVADIDIGDGPATYTVKANPNHGTLNFNQDGSFTYTPAADFNGTDSFTYTLTDSNGDTDSAVATITVKPVGDISNDNTETLEDTPINIDLLDNDSFGPEAKVTTVTQGKNGTVVINQDGTVKYIPKTDFNGSDSFTYTITSNGVTETATVNVTITPVQDAVDDSRTTDVNKAIKVNVLENDSFHAGAVIAGVTQAQNGAVVINPDGTVQYTPNSNFSGTDHFSYTVRSGEVNETATVTIVVNAKTGQQENPNPVDLDNDNDGIPDSQEGTGDTDNDGIPDFRDLDSDNDGITDTIEAGGRDADGDGRIDEFRDTNQNGLSDQVEPSLGGLPLLVYDTDGDGVADYRDLDSDNDGITDVIEAGGSDPEGNAIIGDGIPIDRNKDGLSDSIDPNQGGSRLPIPDQDSDGLPDYRDLDSDNDGISDLREQGSDLTDHNRDGKIDGSDSDGDGLMDQIDGNDSHFASSTVPIPTPQDKDGNGIADFREPPSGKHGSQRSDTVMGTDGDDILNGFSDLDILNGGGGNDVINGGSDADRLRGDSGNDTLNGGSNNDDMDGGIENDILNGGTGNDTMLGSDGDDILNGGQGRDYLNGGTGNDQITGNEDSDRLYGDADNDRILGDRGNDLLVGGFGKDTLTGGQGRDKFAYGSVQELGDVITDFEIVKDRFDLKKLFKGSSGSIQDVRCKQRGENTLVQVDINGWRNLAVLEDVQVNTLAPRHFML